MLDKDRLEVQNKGRSVFLKAVDGSHTKEFNSISDCVDYLNTIAFSYKTTLYRHIETGIPYHGYICKFANKKTRGIKVSVTHVASNETIIYSSLREAALSFELKYITTGQTIKAYAESGRLFKNEYKIILI
jgi:hypothetical protein